MINRALTSTFDLPEDQFASQVSSSQRQPRQSAAGQPKYDDAYFGIEPIAQGLQYTGEISKQSEKYFQEREKLRQFARSNWLNSRIDVTAPDPSNPAAVRAAQIYQMGLANLNYQGDLLKESQKAFTRKDTLADQGEYMFEDEAFDQPMAMNIPQQSGYTTNVDPRLKFAGEQLGKTFSASEFPQAQQNLQGVQQMFANQASPDSRFSQDTAALAQTITPNKQVFAPRDSGRGSGASSPISGLASEWAQLSVGKHPTFRLTEKVGKGGSYLSESTNNSFVNKQYGQYLDQNGVPRPFIISRLERDNDTGEVTAFTAEGIAKPLPKDNIDVSMRQVIDKSQINEYEKYLQDLDREGLLPKVQGQGGGTTTLLPPDIFVPATDEAQAKQVQIQAQSIKPAVEQIRSQISSDLDLLDSSFWSGTIGNIFRDKPVPTELEYNSPFGKIKIERSGENYKILVDGKVFESSDPQDSKKKIRTFNKQFTDNFLRSYQVESMMLKDKNGKVIAKPSTQTSQPEIDPDI